MCLHRPSREAAGQAVIQDIDPRILLAIAAVCFSGLLAILYFAFTDRGDQ